MSPIVCYDEWLSHNENYLLHLYEMLQEANQRSGRLVFDNDKCKFPQFCKLAYNWSTLYTPDSSWMYDDGSEEDYEYDIDT